MKIGMLTLYDQAFEDVARRTLPNKQWYADRQRYPLIVERALIDPSRNGSWNKIPAIKKHLARFDWLFWMDIDSLVANPEVRPESLIDVTKSIVFPSDSGREGGYPGNAPGEPRINASHFLIRNCPWSKAFLDVVYRQEQFLDHKWWEQKAMMHVLDTQPDYQGRVRTLPDRVMKSNPVNYEPDDFIVHFGGRDKLARIDAFFSSESTTLRDGNDVTSVQRAVRAELSDSYYIYRRVGQSAYPLRLLDGGTIEGARQDERKWSLEWRDNRPAVTLKSRFETICELSEAGDGSWTGEQPGDPPVRIELIRHRAQTLVDKLRTTRGRLIGVEVGAYTGDTSVILLESLPDLTLVMVDAWRAAEPGDRWQGTGDPYAKIDQDEMDDRMLTAVRRTRLAADRRIVLVADHVSAANVLADGLDFVFLDADHSHEGTLQAIRAWWPKVASDGLMAGHDYGHPDYPGVERAVHEFAEKHDLMVHVAPDFVWYLETPS